MSDCGFEMIEESYKYGRCCKILNLIGEGDAQMVDKRLPAAYEALRSERNYS